MKTSLALGMIALISSLRVYDAPNYAGNLLCLSGTGSASLGVLKRKQPELGECHSELQNLL